MNIQKLRLETPGCLNRIHFNNAGAAFPPNRVLEKMQSILTLESEIGGYETADFLAGELADFYPVLAKFLGCEPRNIAFTHSATDSWNLALSAIPFEAGDTILTTLNDYASNQISFLSMQKRLNIKVLRAKELPHHGGVDLQDLEEKIIEHRPKLVAVTHVPTNSGLVQPIEKVGEICRRAGVWFLVDGCQSAGQMPLDMAKIGCDFFSATGRKYVRGPRTSGFLFVSDRALEGGLEPLFIDMFGANWTGDDYAPRSDARRFEQYENAPSLVLGLKVAVEYALEIGLENIEKRVVELAKYTRNRLKELPNCQVLDFGERKCGIVTAHFSEKKPNELMQYLSSKNINCRISAGAAATLDFQEKKVDWVLRISPHYYNLESEIDVFIDELKTFLY
jgi:selenocysteine lyase/cysteine desulfurase